MSRAEPKRQRLRQVSPERVAKVWERLAKAGCPLEGFKLSTDGSVTVLTPRGNVHVDPQPGDDENEWDEVLAK